MLRRCSADKRALSGTLPPPVKAPPLPEAVAQALHAAQERKKLKADRQLGKR